MNEKKVCEHCGELPAEHRLSLANLKGELLDTILICNPCYEDCKISKCVKSGLADKEKPR